MGCMDMVLKQAGKIFKVVDVIKIFWILTEMI